MRSIPTTIRLCCAILFVAVLLYVGCSKQSSDQGTNFLRGELPASVTPREAPKMNPTVGETLSKSLQGGFEDKGSWRQYFFIFLSFLCFGAVIALLVYLDRRHRHSSADGQNSYESLFLALASVHELTKMEQTFLHNAATELGLDHPLLFFVEPSFFYLIRDRRESDADHEMIQAFLRKLFGIESVSDNSDLRLTSPASLDTVLVKK